MNNVARTRATKLESVLSAGSLLPVMLAANTIALVALEQLGGIPQWVKSAVALFLAF